MITSSPSFSEKSPSFATSRADVAARLVFLLCASLGILLLGGLLALFAAESIAFIRAVDHVPVAHSVSLVTLVANTLLVSLVALAIAVPIGLLAALYSSEFADLRVRRALEPLLRFLAGVPPIVYGYFAVSTFLPELARFAPSLDNHPVVTAGVALATMILPLFLEHARAAVSAVSQHLRDGACALGAGKFATAALVVVPAARSRLLAALLLATSRAVGETMIVLVVLSTVLPGQTATATTLTAFIAQAGATGIASGTHEFGVFFVVGSALLVLAFALDALRLSLDKPVRGDAP